MSRFICANCGAKFYSASPLETHYNQTCARCGGLLVERAEPVPSGATQEIPLVCGDCGTRWVGVIETPLKPDVFRVTLRALNHCPECGGNRAIRGTLIM